MKVTAVIIFLALIRSTTSIADDMWRNQYDSPYSDGPSYTDGSQDYNDVSNQYGRPLGGPTLWGDDGKYYQCDNYGNCYEAF